MRIRGLKFWPQSLYGQILLVVALALLVAQSINAWMLLSLDRGRAVVEASTMVVGRVASQVERASEFGIPIEEGSYLQVNKNGKPARFRMNNVPMIVDDAPLQLDRFKSQSEMAERANEFLEQTDSGLNSAQMALGPVSSLPNSLRWGFQRRPTGSTMQSGKRHKWHDAVLLSVRMKDGKWINAAARVRPKDTSSVVAMLFQTLTLYIAVMIPLALVARRIAKPLERLKQRVQRVGLTDEIAPLESEGPADIRQLVDAFNAMQSRVSSLLGEKDVMLGAIGHDLKTPLAALRVRVESVEDSQERDKMASTIDEMVTILDDILMLARLGKSGEAMQRTDIDALIGSVIEEFEDAGTPVAFPTGEGRHIANIRPVLLRRALRNLIGNAIAYGKNASASVINMGNKTLIQIDDDGPGISADQIDAMFEPFARAETSRSRTTGGSGLGLTISRAIARSHGGDVHLSNRPEGGLRATLELPGN